MVRWITSHAEYTEFRNPDFYLRTANFYVPVLIRMGDSAVGITNSRKVGIAVRRNLLKRRIKAWFGQHHALLPLDYKLVLSARSGAGELSWQELSDQLQTICQMLQKRKPA